MGSKDISPYECLVVVNTASFTKTLFADLIKYDVTVLIDYILFTPIAVC
jgi:hypothetical protein